METLSLIREIWKINIFTFRRLDRAETVRGKEEKGKQGWLRTDQLRSVSDEGEGAELCSQQILPRNAEDASGAEQTETPASHLMPVMLIKTGATGM